MAVIFRNAQSEDIEEIVELCNECFSEKNSLKYAKEMFEATKNDPNQIYVVGIYNHKIIAHAKATIIPTMYSKMNTYAILNHVCVKEVCRRKQVATKMLDYITDICRERGCIALKLWSKNFRTAAHACYYHYGFTREDAGFFSKKIKKSGVEE